MLLAAYSAAQLPNMQEERVTVAPWRLPRNHNVEAGRTNSHASTSLSLLVLILQDQKREEEKEEEKEN